MAAPHYNFMGTLDGSKVTCGAIWWHVVPSGAPIWGTSCSLFGLTFSVVGQVFSSSDPSHQKDPCHSSIPITITWAMCMMKRHCPSRGCKPSFCRSPFLSCQSSPPPSVWSHSSSLQTSRPIQDFIGLSGASYRAITATAPLSHLGQLGPALLRPRCRPVSTEGNLRGRHPTIYCSPPSYLTNSLSHGRRWACRDALPCN